MCPKYHLYTMENIDSFWLSFLTAKNRIIPLLDSYTGLEIKLVAVEW